MGKSIISEGKTTNEAIEKGLKELKLPRDMVEVKVLENEDKRSFFSILAPRIVKVEMTVKENKTEKIEKFLKDFVKELPENTEYSIEKTDKAIKVNIFNKDLGYLIGYRGETLYALQNILSAIASKGIKGKIRIILDIEGYKSKREKTLEDLAEKVAKTVIKTRKPVKLEPMQAYERKIIHSKLQENTRVETVSVGEEPHRRIVISLKNK